MVAEVEISSLEAMGSPRSSGEDPDHIEALAEVMVPLPPIIVHRSTMRVIDGVHRLRAAQLRGDSKIAVSYFEGTEADAFVLAVESNITHGLPLAMADRKRAAGRIIVSHPQWSDRMIASVTGVAPATVAEIRRRTSGGTAATGSRIGQDGRVRPVNGAAGRETASRLIAENPGLSLRQIARAAGISPETARDVRNRMRRGEDPLPKPVSKAASNKATGAVAASRVPSGARETIRLPAAERAAAMERLKSDPALRFNERGRTLLRLLNIHLLSEAELQELIDHIPPHCSGIVANLAHECAGVWRELALRANQQVAVTA
ncbi:ParB N-terminal domain-containing protein [Streptomyces sp. A7024]|uniref:ParB N-terminal domain-containing protein n=2 Tax=Streptomyces coryli TaxID=1128680 RepID=A0A6G4U389_9ACTN|nr:ParB N-terminal domain-containing protein [Streptomyces coryli]